MEMTTTSSRPLVGRQRSSFQRGAWPMPPPRSHNNAWPSSSTLQPNCSFLVIINYVNQWIRRQINEESCSAPWPEVTTFPCLKFPSTGNRHQQLQKPTLQPYLKNSHTSIKFNNKKELLKPLIVWKDWQSVVSLVRDEILERPPWRPNQAWCCWPSSWAGGTAHH